MVLQQPQVLWGLGAEETSSNPEIVYKENSQIFRHFNNENLQSGQLKYEPFFTRSSISILPAYFGYKYNGSTFLFEIQPITVLGWKCFEKAVFTTETLNLSKIESFSPFSFLDSSGFFDIRLPSVNFSIPEGCFENISTKIERLPINVTDVGLTAFRLAVPKLLPPTTLVIADTVNMDSASYSFFNYTTTEKIKTPSLPTGAFSLGVTAQEEAKTIDLVFEENATCYSSALSNRYLCFSFFLPRSASIVGIEPFNSTTNEWIPEDSYTFIFEGEEIPNSFLSELNNFTYLVLPFVKSIPESVLSSNSLKRIFIGSACQSIGSNSFANCFSLGAVTIDREENSIAGYETKWGAPNFVSLSWVGV